MRAFRSRHGTRYIDGRLYVLSGRFTGWDARDRALGEAKIYRQRGGYARIMKRDRHRGPGSEYLLFTLGGI
jgi:hypothetical protein